MHAQLIVHGDLKPDNILVVKEAGRIVAKISDFGLSRIHHFCVDGPEDESGTARWESPELLVDNPRKTKQSDIWAFGCIALQVQFGRFPYPANLFQACRMLMEGLPPATADLVDLTLPLSNAVWIQMQGCWAVEPAGRPGAEALATEFEIMVNHFA
ncbi:pkb-activating kinase-like protein [Ceratobasidium sp. 414]|nr:pkb-activating kinase-like protein [Ceratobasidium sp. 414]